MKTEKNNLFIQRENLKNQKVKNCGSTKDLLNSKYYWFLKVKILKITGVAVLYGSPSFLAID